MRKLLSALVLLALVIVMMPAQVARADNEECNANGHDWGAWEKLNEESHRRTCKREGCGATETEAHYDRWASKCGRQPHCEKCGHDYGTIPDDISFYIFILAPRDQGILTDVKAMTGEAFAPANTVAGLVLKWEIIDPADGKAEVRRLEIIETGTYDLEGLSVI